MILQIDVTVTGPDSVMTGSVAVTVNVPATGETLQAAPAAQPAQDLTLLRARQRSQAMRWGLR